MQRPRRAVFVSGVLAFDIVPGVSSFEVRITTFGNTARRGLRVLCCVGIDP